MKRTKDELEKLLSNENINKYYKDISNEDGLIVKYLPNIELEDYYDYYKRSLLSGKKEFDISTFKTFKCSEYSCKKDSHICLFYHNEDERRRPEILFRYNNSICEKYRKERKYKSWWS